MNCACLPNIKYKYTSEVFLDNQASIAIASNPVFHQRTKHISIKYQYVNENAECGNAELEFLRSRDNLADMFTKPVGVNIFLDHSPKVMGGHLVPRVSRMVKSVEKDTLPLYAPTVLRVCLVKT